VEVVVSVGIRIEPAAIVAHGKLAYQPGGREQVQRVVDRCLRHPQSLVAQSGQHLVSREMLRMAEEQRGNAQSLGGGSHAGAGQAVVQALD